MKKTSFPFDAHLWLSNARIQSMLPSQMGGYMQLIAKMWMSEGCSMLFDIDEIKKITKLNTAELKGVLPLFKIENGIMFPALLKEEWTKVNSRKSKKSEPKKPKGFVAPTLEEVIEYFLSKGYSDSVAKRAYEYYEAGNWTDAKGDQIVNWKQKVLMNWFKPENEIKKVSGSNLYSQPVN